MGLELIVNGQSDNYISVKNMEVGQVGIVKTCLDTNYLGALVMMTYGHTLVNLGKPNQTWKVDKFFPEGFKVQLFPKGTKLEFVVN